MQVWLVEVEQQDTEVGSPRPSKASLGQERARPPTPSLWDRLRLPFPVSEESIRFVSHFVNSLTGGPPSQWQTPQTKTPQGQRGWTPNTNSQYAVAANYVPPAGNRGHGRPPQQRPSRSRPQSAGFQQYAGPPSTSVVAPAPAEIEYGTALDEYPEEPVRYAIVEMLSYSSS